MPRHAQSGQANLTTILLLLGLVVSGVWVWKRLSPDMQDLIIDQALPLAALSLAIMAVAWILIGKIVKRRRRNQQRARLIKLFESQTASDKRLTLAFAVIEVNEYRRVGLEAIASQFQELFVTTLKRALGDKQHQVRGMAASHLGVIGDDAAVAHLLAALEDDHAYVRSSAALGLGRLRASAAKDKLAYVSKEDWDQTVRSRAREALERIR
ncbi:MAG: HEAT repeat domain-containing protein [Nitrospira sp.]|uniref:HEAT repeat domain-containing protein n=1 Tax=Nitrospira sp. ND1 TaxID=1658518 RepID=UPI00135651D7|nr:HEAT repeat domain-containing protein [Nitrospira sp. ND1]MBK7418753.1 HEAT repeat domain-containing protein [Nitrospira sp.]MBK8377595.1 HEAT repeat domain-containing protein [Nitrospira sp.]MBK9998784.1 HEAT repeat domain-containing protein [Nitrospira sp.]MBP6204993.1 HEAT repeat domain-containing protein [Nitrospira sp.]MBP8200468.1 HEAT repeat domain-containing protein [Nitrospira sp.]